MTNEMTFGMTFKPTLPARGSDWTSRECPHPEHYLRIEQLLIIMASARPR